MGDFKLGDKVQLNSGGPIMTISGFLGSTDYQPERAECLWFIDKRTQEGTFPLHTLIKVK
jgi:uncharacterized protein YodC (DUF2158 family)